MIKVEKSVFYYPDENKDINDVNSIYITGRCNFNFGEDVIGGSFFGQYSISVDSLFDNGLFIGSKVVCNLRFYSEMEQQGREIHVERCIKNFAVHDYDIMNIFRLSEIYPLNYTIDYVNANICVLYDINSLKLALFDTPRYLIVRCNYSRSDDVTPLPNGFESPYYYRFSVCGLKSPSDLSCMTYDMFCNNALPHFGIAIKHITGLYTLIYSREFLTALYAKDESYFNSLSVSKDLFQHISSISSRKDCFLIPSDLKLCFSNFKLMWNMTTKYADTYIKKQGWDEGLEL